MKSRLLLGVSLLVAFLLVGGMFSPAVFGDPYEPRSESPSYYIAHESATDIEGDPIVVENQPIEADPTPLEAFDDEQQRLFEAIYEEQRDGVHSSPADGEYESYLDLDSDREAYTRTVCEDWTLTCDAYESAPTFPADGSYRYGSKSHFELTFVEYENETYEVVERHQSGSLFQNVVEVLLRFGLFGPLALAISGVAVVARETRPKTVVALTGYGIGLGGLGVATPYLSMFTGTDVLAYATELVLVTWTVISATVLSLWWSDSPPADSDSSTSGTDSGPK
ncbi:hypothetical protein [Natronobacterium gregoryi]|uniref:Uncharacterized protein n=2 Tax=Natronobacterium gregoryi TaxID=44930 RepID=L0AJA3_NATGS|nr:hypothetical protein [Natronobacterium gregoryi]AFZ73529.1 hypothetical protein Natgr_2357 [Natronobacterium gregoryi SP2]ELY68384.1 hypothetical protein C490_09928 [Natronobacterium gregoryi SP2]PLK20569.1 hypothetical protein CYV19_09000 [Natronobacterium gregoryi SP2]SFJ16968.1 hypothetical protein SAMN05443661_11632 [Natronobacterium gregoryi]